MRRGSIIVFVSLLLLAGTSTALAYSRVSDMELVAETDSLALYVDMDTTEIAVTDKRSNVTWHSNPVGDRADAVRHQIRISYYSPDGTQKSLDNYKDSVKLNQFAIEPITGGVRVFYTLGKKWNDDHYVPQLITGESFERDILSRIENGRDAETILDRFIPISLQKASPDVVRTKVEVDRSRLFGDYVLVSPAIEDLDDREDMIWDLLNMIRTNRADVEVTDDITADDLAFLIDNEVYMAQAMPAFIKRNVIAIIQESGYTPEQAQEAHSSTCLDPYEPNMEVFDIPIEYTLDGDDFIARIPADEIVYPAYEGEMLFSYLFTSFTVKDPVMPVNSIRLLEYFGAADASDSGYIFVPDGSGALINFGAVAGGGTAYSSYIYGTDLSIQPIVSKQLDFKQANLPVFGLVKDGSALFGIVEEGDALARIAASVSGTGNKYDRAFVEMIPSPVTKVSLFKTTSKGFFPLVEEVTKNQSRMYQGDFTVRYGFLSGDDAHYVGMAQHYREYLVERCGLQKVKPNPDIPLYLEFIGAVGIDRPVLGLLMEVTEPLTTFADALGIVEDLGAQGVTGINLRYSGWLRRGLDHVYPDGAYVESRLGTRSELDSLNRVLESLGGNLIPSVGFMNVKRNSLMDGFRANRDSARHLNNELVRTYDYSVVTGEGVESGYLLSPSRLMGLVEDFMKSYAGLGIGSIALDYMGHQVYSDFGDEERLVDRQQARDKVTDVLKRVSEDYDQTIAVDGANAYALPYVDHILNMPFTSNDLNISSKSVPFYQIAIHGYVSYAGESINLSSDHRWTMLKTIETGAYPHYTLCHRDPTILKDTAYSHLYSISYQRWRDEMKAFYEKANGALRRLQDSVITGHREIADEVVATDFETGERVVVNYRSEPVTIDGMSIPAQDFILVAEDESNE